MHRPPSLNTLHRNNCFSSNPIREKNGKGRSVAVAALDADLSAEMSDQLFDNRQAEADPAILPRHRPIGLMEGIENLRELLRLNADSGVGDDDLDPFSLRPVFNLERNRSISRELDGIAEQVDQDLLYLTSSVSKGPMRGATFTFRSSGLPFRSGLIAARTSAIKGRR